MFVALFIIEEIQMNTTRKPAICPSTKIKIVSAPIFFILPEL